MPYRTSFDCLWCGDVWTTRGLDDLEGWAQLCSTCLGKADGSRFLRDRLRAGITARGEAAFSIRPAPPRQPAGPPRAVRPNRYQAAFPDDWFLRRGTYELGAVHDTAWAAELDMVTRWLDGLGLSGRIVEPAAGVGFFSPLLAGIGELHAFDADPAALDQARARLVAHRLRAHLHVADPWTITDSAKETAPEAGAEVGPIPDPTPGQGPDPLAQPADVVLAAFLLGRVRGAGLDGAARSLRARLRVGGRLALIELLPDPAGGPPEGSEWTWHEPTIVEAALARAGFGDIVSTPTGRFFRILTATAV